MAIFIVKWIFPDQDTAKWPISHSVEIPVPWFIYLEKLPGEDESSSVVDSTHGQSDSDFEETS